jgi:hypothetical protein
LSYFRFFVKPFAEDGTLQDDFIEITDDVEQNSLGNISRKLENNEFDVGIFRYSDIQVTLRNDHGRYNGEDDLNSIFIHGRAGSIVKVTWEPSYGPWCGVAVCGEETLNDDELIVYEGILNDDAFTTDIATQKAQFKILGFEASFSKVIVPYDDLVLTDTVDEWIYAILNQAEITQYLTVSLANIVPGNNLIPDAKAHLENASGKEALDELLFISNSILYVVDRVVYVKNRNATPTVIKTFYGQASDIGIENIQNISQFREGLNRTFNFWTWENTTLAVFDQSSVDEYGYRKREVSSEAITDNTKITTALNALKTEFAFPKKELLLATPYTIEINALTFLDRIAIDYPTVVYPVLGEELSTYDGASEYDNESYYAEAAFSLTLDTTTNWKILGIDINMKQQLAVFQLREI